MRQSDITSLMRGKFLARLWLTKTFGNKHSRYIDPDTGEEVLNGVPVESQHDMAACLWSYIWHGQTDRYDKDLVTEQVWYDKASNADIELQAQMEDADRLIYGGA